MFPDDPTLFYHGMLPFHCTCRAGARLSLLKWWCNKSQNIVKDITTDTGDTSLHCYLSSAQAATNSRRQRQQCFLAIQFLVEQYPDALCKINRMGMLGDNEDRSDDSEVQAEAVSSFFPHKALFKINFRPKQNEEIITCLAEQSVRNRRQIHPLLLIFLHQETKNKESVFFGETIVQVYTEYKREDIIFRSHPNYNSFGEWYDWVMLDFDAPEDESD